MDIWNFSKYTPIIVISKKNTGGYSISINFRDLLQKEII